VGEHGADLPIRIQPATSPHSKCGLQTSSYAKRGGQKKGQTIIPDDLVAGFGVRLTPTKASYIVTWRESDGRRSRETIRAHVGAVTVAQARDMARKRLGEVIGTAEQGAGVPLRMAMRNWFERQSELGVWRPRYRVRVDSTIAIYFEGEARERIKLTPSASAAIANIGAKPVASVTRSDVMRVADSLRPGTAEAVMAIGSSYYGAAFERGVVLGNPFKNRLRVTGGCGRARSPMMSS
jgi:hypothetical protein